MENKGFLQLFCNFLCSVSIVLNNKQSIILLNLAEYALTVANSAYGLVGKVSCDIPLVFAEYL